MNKMKKKYSINISLIQKQNHDIPYCPELNNEAQYRNFHIFVLKDN